MTSTVAAPRIPGYIRQFIDTPATPGSDSRAVIECDDLIDNDFEAYNRGWIHVAAKFPAIGMAIDLTTTAGRHSRCIKTLLYIADIADQYFHGVDPLEIDWDEVYKRIEQLEKCQPKARQDLRVTGCERVERIEQVEHKAEPTPIKGDNEADDSELIATIMCDPQFSDTVPARESLPREIATSDGRYIVGTSTWTARVCDDIPDCIVEVMPEILIAVEGGRVAVTALPRLDIPADMEEVAAVESEAGARCAAELEGVISDLV
ncbi:hypothetical protein [Corynebacterium pyruviciproducens]